MSLSVFGLNLLCVEGVTWFFASAMSRAHPMRTLSGTGGKNLRESSNASFSWAGGSGCLMLLGCLCGASAALAADAAYSEAEFLEELPTVLTASRLRQPISEAPNAMTVIDRDMITASGFRNLADLLKLVPGMYVSYYKGAQPIVSYHGSLDQYARSMQVLIDGRSVYLPPTNLVDWAALPIIPADIERIEVIRGPAAASYGANSVHGVINIITHEATLFNGTNVAVTRGNNGINDVQGQFGAHGEKFDYRMTLAYTADNGYDDRTAMHFPSSFPQLMNNSNDSNQARLLNYRANYYPREGDDLDIQFGVSRDVQGVGFWDSHLQRNPFHDLIHENGFLMLTWQHQLGNDSELTARVAHTRSTTREQLNPGVTAQPARNDVNVDVSVLTVQHALALAADNRVLYGMELEQDDARGTIRFLEFTPTVHRNTLNRQAARLFAHDEWRISRQFVSNVGGMWEDDGQGNTRFSPRGALNIHVVPDHTLRVGVSVAYRTPSFTEQYNAPSLPYQLGDRFTVGVQKLALAPEKTRSREIGYLGQFNRHASSLDVRIFKEQFSHGIFPTRTGFANGLTGSFTGVETTFKHDFDAQTHLTLNHAREYGRSNVPALQPGLRDLLAGSIPRNSMSALFMHQFARGFSVSAAVYRQGAMQPFDRGVMDFQPKQKRVDVRVAQQLKQVLGINGELAGVVQNLFKQNYTEYVASNVFDQRAYVTLKLNF